jgi:hypothetical protein
MNKRITRLLGPALLAILLLAATVVLAQGEPLLNWQVIAGGGGPSSDGSSVAINDTLGQPVVGPSSDGGSIALGAGYWYGTGAPRAVTLYLPLVTK